jgi:hypothetical protein
MITVYYYNNNRINYYSDGRMEQQPIKHHYNNNNNRINYYSVGRMEQQPNQES